MSIIRNVKISCLYYLLCLFSIFSCVSLNYSTYEIKDSLVVAAGFTKEKEELTALVVDVYFDFYYKFIKGTENTEYVNISEKIRYNLSDKIVDYVYMTFPKYYYNELLVIIIEHSGEELVNELIELISSDEEFKDIIITKICFIPILN